MYRPSCGHARIKFDLAKGALVTDYVLLQDIEQRLRLLRAQIDALEVIDLDLGLALLLQGAKGQEKVPDIDPHLHAVGIIFAIVGGVDELDIGLSWIRHKGISVAASTLWTQRYILRMHIELAGEGMRH